MVDDTITVTPCNPVSTIQFLVCVIMVKNKKKPIIFLVIINQLVIMIDVVQPR